ncbi:MAG: lytic transglycosylase domain-containing protein [Terriglobales bacterium]
MAEAFLKEGNALPKPATPSRTLKLVGLLLLLFLSFSTSVRAADVANSTADADRFSNVHQSLDRAADSLLSQLDPGTSERQKSQLVLPSSPSEERIRDFAQRFWGNHDQSLRRALSRVTAVRSEIDPILRAEGVPQELLAVVLVESAGNATALSRTGARGLWQFIPETARRYGLKVGRDGDERLVLERATRAAARHLRDLYTRFGDWELALAGYNAGPEAVERAIRRAGGKAQFSLLADRKLLPAETRDYVPAVLSAAELLTGPDRLGRPDANARARKALPVVYASIALGDEDSNQLNSN